MSIRRWSVVKLGGSILESAQLQQALAVLRAHDPVVSGLVVVCGGGAVADHVRIRQDSLRFDDAFAHRMAVCAMQLQAWMLCGLLGNARPFDSLEALLFRESMPSTTVWLPERMVLSDPGIEASWRVTSDSLCAFLARRIAALPGHEARVLLWKSCPVPDAQRRDATALAADGIVDGAFPALVDGLPFDVLPPRAWTTRMA